MELHELQSLLAILHGIEVRADIRDFLVTDRRHLASWSSPDRRDTREELLIEERDDGDLGVALYLEGALVERLAGIEPRQLLQDDHFEDYCTAIEGVSHFNYVAWNAARDWPVTLLELEMQAEVDKYASARFLLGRSAAPGVAGLLPRFFAGARFDALLPRPVLRRYEDAWSLAARYCRSLEARFPEDMPGELMLRELRRFFRLPQPGKISHIRTAVLAA